VARANLDTEWFNDEFKSSIMLALALHCCVLMVAFIVAKILIPTSPPDAALEILKASVRVDVVGMPKMTIAELRSLQAEATPPKADPQPSQATKAETVEAPPKPDDIVLPAKEPKKSLGSLLADYSSKKVPTTKKETKGDARGKSQLDSLILEGNRLSKGTALVGDVSDTADAPFVAYVQTLPELVRAHWRLPSFLKDQNLQCRVHVWVSANGQLIRTQLRESSGNSDYDNRAILAIQQASPFPPPPAEAAEKLASRGIILGFPL
jgi:colicin import membrane protein